MTATASGTTPRGYVDRVIAGRPVEVANVLRSMADRGRLVAATVPRPAAGDPSRVVLTVRLVAPAPRAASSPAVVLPARSVRRQLARRTGLVVAAAAGTAVVLAAIGYAVLWLVGVVMATWPVLLCVAAAVTLLRRLWRRR